MPKLAVECCKNQLAGFAVKSAAGVIKVLEKNA
jgi:hypothetical protein